MRSLASLFLGLMLLAALAIGQPTRASAPMACGEVASAPADIFHYEGDADEVPADEDGAYPHHHSTGHDHSAGISPTGGDDIGPALAASAPWLTQRSSEPASGTDPGLRPPRA
jgi:hypothetical protein